jgi:hypothetical protein
MQTKNRSRGNINIGSCAAREKLGSAARVQFYTYTGIQERPDRIEY